MIKCTDYMHFFQSNLWLHACFKFLMCITYSVLSCKLATSFSTVLIFILPGKKLNHCQGYVNSQKIKQQIQGNILHQYHHGSFL